MEAQDQRIVAQGTWKGLWSSERSQIPRKEAQDHRIGIKDPRGKSRTLEEARVVRKAVQGPRKEAQAAEKEAWGPSKETQGIRKKNYISGKEALGFQKEAWSPRKEAQGPWKKD